MEGFERGDKMVCNELGLSLSYISFEMAQICVFLIKTWPVHSLHDMYMLCYSAIFAISEIMYMIIYIYLYIYMHMIAHLYIPQYYLSVVSKHITLPDALLGFTKNNTDPTIRQGSNALEEPKTTGCNVPRRSPFAPASVSMPCG